MKKFFWIAPLAAVALWATALTMSLPTKPPIVLNQYEKAQIQTVLIRTPDGTGSGVVIQRANTLGELRLFVWTAAHVVRGFNQVEIVRPGRQDGAKLDCETTWSATVIARDDHIDIALLWLDSHPSDLFLPVEFEFAIPRVGESVYHCGNYYGLSFDGSVSIGIVSQIGVHLANNPSWHWELVDQASAVTFPGSSGGGIFNAQGKVIGLLVGGPIGTEGISCYVPVRIIDKWATSEGFSWALAGLWCPQDNVLRAFNMLLH